MPAEIITRTAKEITKGMEPVEGHPGEFSLSPGSTLVVFLRSGLTKTFPKGKTSETNVVIDINQKGKLVIYGVRMIDGMLTVFESAFFWTDISGLTHRRPVSTL